MPTRSIPEPTLKRLAGYLRCLSDLDLDLEFIASEELGRRTQCPAELVRRDLSYFGEFGRRGVGYNVTLLRQTIARILHLNRPQGILIVGAGNLGRALISYPGWHQYQLVVAGAYDSDPEKIGERIGDVVVEDIEQITSLSSARNARLALLTVPAENAQRAAEKLVDIGIQGILNFAPTPVETPAHVIVRNVSFINELAVLSYLTAET